MPLLSRLAVQAARAYGMLVSGSATNVPASYLVVAGGGGGAAHGGAVRGGGGGGAGGYLESTTTLSTLNTYSITVGAGGIGTGDDTGSNGSNSVLSGTGITTITSVGGGVGRAFTSGVAGGSGGGGGYISGAGGAGTAGQGNNGGAGGTATGTTSDAGGGGGGAGGVGGNGTSSGAGSGGTGGAGIASSISGTSVSRAGGGGGGNGNGNGGTATAGGGTGGSTGSAGTANTGGGGGGKGTGTGGNGGSGIVIISYTSATPKFVGGTLTTSGGNQIHTFTSSGTLSPITPITASYLVVAGGGSGSTSVGYTEASGGGGAGGLLSGSTTIYSGATYVVTVGAGGAGSGSYAGGNNGSNSVLSGTGITTITSTGGGRGNADGPGENGGSGGAGGAAVTSRAGGTGIAGQGNNGGSGFGSATTSVRSGGGGGGSGAAGANATSGQGGAGGAGTASSITGTSVTYAAGGGGSSQTAGASGGSSVGGNGQGLSPATSTTSGIVNTGSGGGAAINTNGGSGGSGIVIISYAGSQAFNGGLVTSSGGNTIHTFTSTGALTPLTNNLTNSLRFRRSNSAYLSRTPTIAGSQTTWTWSAWVKRGTLGSQQKIFTAGSSGSLFASFEFIAGDNFQFFAYNGSTNAYLVTTQVFRDPSAWYHITFVSDTTQATAANRIRIYINGTQVTAFSTSTYPSQNFAFPINNSVIHNIGRDNINAADYFDGYLADINFIDGQALEPYYFGNNDANGVWKPIAYKGTYGTNGFYLNFSNTTSTTTLGFDSSPNGNNWTTNNISLTAGVTYDAMSDVPTLTSATTANYATLNPVDNPSSSNSLANANLTASTAGASGWRGIRATMAFPTTGKWYYEVTLTSGTNNLFLGIVSSAATGVYHDHADTFAVRMSDCVLRPSGATATGTQAGYAVGDIFGVAIDCSTPTVQFYKNGSLNVTYTSPTFDPSKTYFPCFLGNDTGASATHNFNFGQRPFSYTPPTGFVRLNTFNLPTPTILQGNRFMDATLYTGNGSTQVVVNQAQFQPDFVWIKNRAATYWHELFDINRGVGNSLSTNATDQEYNNAGFGYLSAFNSNGFTVTKGSSDSFNVNSNGVNYVGWGWKGAGSTSSNTSGSITSTVSVNATAGFSVVTYTGTGANATVGHGLGVAPAMIIFKQRNAVRGWPVYHRSLGASTTIYLNVSNASNADSTIFNATSPTSSVFSLGASADTNASAGTYVAYCWADVSGYSRAFSYTGNGSADGSFVFCGFLPRFILIKRTDTTGDWYMWDTARNTYDVITNTLLANSSAAETSATSIDALSNGFKLRNTTAGFNASGGTYIGMAWATNPFKNSNAF